MFIWGHLAMNSIATLQPGTGAVHRAEIDSIATGGAGVARIEGRVVFIARTVPGDSVRFRISEDKGRFLRGEIEEIESPGTSRREPPCPHWASCGGCPLQQMTPEAQAESKRQIFLDALARIGKIDAAITPEIIAADTPEFAYRMRARFQIKNGGIGFFAPGTRNLIPVEGCLLAEEPINAAFSEIQKFQRLEPAARGLEAVEISSLDGISDKEAGLFLYPIGWHDKGDGVLSKKTRRAWEAFSEKNGWPLAAAGDRGPSEASSWKSRYEVEGPAGDPLALQVSPESFLQPNRRVNRLIVRAVLEMAALPEGGRAVDLFCGAGNFAVPLAGRAGRVVGIESNPFAVKDAEANAKEAGLDNTLFIKSEAGRAEADEILGALGGRPDLVLLDPPRRGALETIPLAAALRPSRIVYISCNPATFARDARDISLAGYRMEAALIAPMFPNTAHVESVTSWALESDTAPR